MNSLKTIKINNYRIKMKFSNNNWMSLKYNI